MKGPGASQLPSSSTPQEQRLPPPRYWNLFQRVVSWNPLEELGHYSVQHRQKQSPGPSQGVLGPGHGAQNSGQEANGTPGGTNCRVSQGQVGRLHSNPKGGGDNSE